MKKSTEIIKTINEVVGHYIKIGLPYAAGFIWLSVIISATMEAIKSIGQPSVIESPFEAVFAGLLIGSGYLMGAWLGAAEMKRELAHETDTETAQDN